MTTIVGTPQMAGGAFDTAVTKPAGATTGDYYIVAVLNQDEDSTPPDLTVAGFTSLVARDGMNGSPGDWWHIQVYAREYDGTEGSTFSVSGLATWRYIYAWIVRDWDGSTVDVGDVTQVVGAGNVPVAGTTVSNSSAAGVIVYADYDDDASATAPPGWSGYLGPFDAAWTWVDDGIPSGATGTLTVGRTKSSRAMGRLVVFSEGGGPPPDDPIPAPLWAYRSTILRR
jgi:hypothetical protein